MMMDALHDELVLRAASFLRSRDLLSLSLSSRRFGGRDDGRSRSLAEEAARTILAERQTQEEGERLPKREEQTWLALHSEWENYRTPPSFDQLIGGSAKYAANDDSSRVLLGGGLFEYNSAISDQVMRSGRHYVSFRCEGSALGVTSVGIMRPAKGLSKIISNRRSSSFHPVYSCRLDFMADFYGGYSGLNCLMYQIGNGQPSYYDCGSRVSTRGRRPIGDAEEVGMVLDLDEGSLTAFRNGEQEWVQRNLTGEFCWVVINSFGSLKACVLIGREGGLPHAQSSQDGINDGCAWGSGSAPSRRGTPGIVSVRNS